MGDRQLITFVACFGAVTIFASMPKPCGDVLAGDFVAYDGATLTAKLEKLGLEHRLLPSTLGARYRITQEGTSSSWLRSVAAQLDERGISLFFSEAFPEGKFLPPVALYFPHDALDATAATPGAGHELRHALTYAELRVCRVNAPPPPPLPKHRWNAEDGSMAHGTVLARFFPKQLPSELMRSLYAAPTGYGADEVHFAYAFEAESELALARRTKSCRHAARVRRTVGQWRELWAAEREMLQRWQRERPMVKADDEPLFDRSVTFSDGSRLAWSRRQAERRMVGWDVPVDEDSIPTLLTSQLAAIGSRIEAADAGARAVAEHCLPN